MFVKTEQQIYQELIRQRVQRQAWTLIVLRQKKKGEQEWRGKKELLCSEKKELYKSYLIRNSDFSTMRKTYC